MPHGTSLSLSLTHTHATWYVTHLGIEPRAIRQSP